MAWYSGGGYNHTSRLALCRLPWPRGAGVDAAAGVDEPARIDEGEEECPASSALAAATC